MTRGAPEHTAPVDPARAAVAWAMSMSLAVPISKLVEAVISDRYADGSTRDSSPENDVTARNANELPAAPADVVAAYAAFNELSSRIGNSLLASRTKEAFLSAIQVLLANGINVEIASISLVISRSVDPSQLADEYEDEIHGCENYIDEISESLKEALYQAALIYPSMHKLMASDEFSRLAERAMLDRMSDPNGYLNDLPHEISQAVMLAEMGDVARAAVPYIKEKFDHSKTDTLLWAAQTWRDGAIATSKIIASLFPDIVPEDVVPQSDRFDVEALVEEHRFPFAAIKNAVLDDDVLLAGNIAMERMDELLRRNSFAACAAILDRAVIEDIGSAVALGLASITKPAIEISDARERFMLRVYCLLIKETGDKARVDNLLWGNG